MMEAAAYCHLPVLRNMDKLLEPITNVKYGSCYLKFLSEQTDTYLGALILYNGGYRALALYDKGVNVPNETSQYVLQVQRIRHLCTTSSQPVHNTNGENPDDLESIRN